MVKAFGYLWLAPETSGEQAEQTAERCGSQLQNYAQQCQWDWQGLQRDHSLQRKPAERPALKSLLQRMQSQDILLVQSLLHLGRRFHDVYHLLQWFAGQRKGELVAVEQGLHFNAQTAPQILSLLHQFPQLDPESTLSVQEGPAPKRSEISRHNGGACPYGYRVNQENEYELIPEEAQIVRRIYKQRTRGHSLRQIVRDLSHQKVPTKRGGKWQPNTIKNILENPFYMGIYQTHYADFENNHPAIISQELYYELNAHLLHDDIGM